MLLVTTGRYAWRTRWKVLWESTNPRESVFVANTWQHLPHFVFCGSLVSNFPTELFCKQSPVYGVFWPLLPHLSSDRNETRSWSSLPPRNLHIKFGTNPSTIFLVIVVTDRQTDTHTHTNKPTPVKIYSLAFAGIIKLFTDTVPLYNYWPIGIFYRNPDRHRILLQASWCVVYDAVSSRVAYKTQEHDAVAITYVRASQTERRARAATATEYSNIE